MPWANLRMPFDVVASLVLSEILAAACRAFSKRAGRRALALAILIGHDDPRMLAAHQPSKSAMLFDSLCSYTTRKHGTHMLSNI